jgi:hypothetical protein
VGLRLQANLGSFYYIDSVPLAPQQNNHLLMLANSWMKLPQVIDIYIIFGNKLSTFNDGICDISCAFQVSRRSARTATEQDHECFLACIQAIFSNLYQIT